MRWSRQLAGWRLLALAVALLLPPAPAQAQGFLGIGPYSSYGTYSMPRNSLSLVPAISLYNGQTSSMLYQSYSWAPVNVQVVQNGGQVAFVPQYQPIPLGMELPVQAAMGRGGLFNRLSVAPTISRSGLGPPFAVATFITPVFDGGAQGPAVPFTQYLAQPGFGTAGLQTTVNVPVGGYGYLGNYRSGFFNRNQAGVPGLGGMPFVGPAFNNVQAGGGFGFAPFLAPQVNVFPFP